MINKNQYEKSVIFLNENIPTFVKNAYTEFIRCMSEVSDIVSDVSKTHPSTANEFCKELIINSYHRPQFLAAYSNMLNNYKNGASDIRLQKIKSGIEVKTSMRIGENKLTADEKFYNMHSPDIVAPVTKISPVISSYSAINKEMNTGGNYFGDKNVAISYTINDATYDNFSETLSGDNWGNAFGYYSTKDIKDFNGINTCFDYLSSSCNIDIFNLFDFFFDIVQRERTDSYDDLMGKKGLTIVCIKISVENGSVYVNKDKDDNYNYTKTFIDLVSRIIENHSKEYTERILHKVTAKILRSAMATYFVFASKIIGAKNDITSWAYKAFVKDSNDHFDIDLYPTAASVNLHTGLGTSGSSSDYDKRSVDISTAISDSAVARDASNATSADRARIYRNLRIQYSVWSSVMNAIFAVGSYGSTYPNGFEEERYNHNNYGSMISRNREGRSVFQSLDSSYDSKANKLVELAKKALMQYLKARYRTYNTYYQHEYGSSRPYKSTDNTNVVASRIKDEKSVKIIKDLFSEDNYMETLFIPLGDKSEALLAINDSAISHLARTFLQISYIVMLTGVHNHIDRVKNEIDPILNKSNKEIFEEIYYGLAATIRKDVNAFSHTSDSAIILNEFEKLHLSDAIVLCTPYSIRNSNEYEYGMKMYDTGYSSYQKAADLGRYIDKDSSAPKSIKNIIEKDSHYKYYASSYFTNLCDVPFFSEYTAIKDTLDENSYLTNARTPIIETQTSEIFPKHRLILENLEKLNRSPRLGFKSLEDAHNTVISFENMLEIGAEGADGMANNSGYSLFGSLGGGITDFEVTTDGIDWNSDKENIYVSHNKGDNQFSNDVDANGYMLSSKKDESPEDQVNLTHHSMESGHAYIEKDAELKLRKDIIYRYDKMFNEYILGI